MHEEGGGSMERKLPIDGVMGGTEDRDAAGEDRRNPEPPRGELPDWLAKELFRIFV